ncbi:hypothetical protein ACHAXS_011329 [Conticribra weissflogii]
MHVRKKLHGENHVSASTAMNANQLLANSQSSSHEMDHPSLRKRQTRAFIVLTSLGFMGMLVLDVMTQSNGDLFDASTAASNIEVRNHAMNNIIGGFDGINANIELHPMENAADLVRKLEESPFDESDPAHAPAHRSIDGDNNEGTAESTGVYDPNASGSKRKSGDQKPCTLHALPLIPKHALEHRKRRELIAAKKPIPRHLLHNEEDEKFHAPPHQRKRMYPKAKVENPEGDGQVQIVDTRMVQRRMAGEVVEEDGEDQAAEVTLETGELYQGYGTHYIDLWVGSPPQRQTVIVDTGSSTTAFPCSECIDCGVDEDTGDRYHIDPNFDETISTTFQQPACRPKWAAHYGREIRCTIGTCQFKSDTNNYCEMIAMYAEGSSWVAKASSDVVYPMGPHKQVLSSPDSLENFGIGGGMGDIADEKPFDWMDFRLTFGCQIKLHGMFNSQLENGIMGMDNRLGSFWLQLYEHYKRNGYKKEDDSGFDPSQFALCYDRRPSSFDLEEGVGSGQLTLGGSDPLLHRTTMVYAENVTPSYGWYTVRVKAMFLRPKGAPIWGGGTDSEYFRVDASEEILNGKPGDQGGIIVDSGTTDTYLAERLKPAFNVAFQEALGDPTAEYHNDPIELSLEALELLPTILVVLKGHAKSVADGSQPDSSSAVGMVGHVKHYHEMLVKEYPHHDTTSDIDENDIIVAIPPLHYMEESRAYPGVYVSRIYFTERFGSQNIFGSNFIMGHDVLFDSRNGRLGFAESHCNHEEYLSDKEALLQTE